MSTTIPCAGCERREACELIERCLDKTPLHDDYKPLDLSQIASAPPDGGPKLEACPVCGSEAGLWQYSESETAPRQLVVMCSHGEAIGPQDGIRNEGCLLYMPPEAFYQARIADAVRYWNEFAKALTAMRTGGVQGMAPVQLEVGRRYLVRNGATVHINESGVGCFYGDFGPGNARRRYSPDGRYCGPGAQAVDSWDIVADADGVRASEGSTNGTHTPPNSGKDGR